MQIMEIDSALTFAETKFNEDSIDFGKEDTKYKWFAIYRETDTGAILPIVSEDRKHWKIAIAATKDGRKIDFTRFGEK